MTTRSKTVTTETNPHEFFAWAYGQGWTDGLPVIPPTPELVEAMMSTVDLAPDHVVANLAPKRTANTVEKIAVNAVMAGCLPEYFPVVIAAVEASTKEVEGFSAYSMNTTTNSGVGMYMVNGPIRAEIGMNCSWSCLGPGNRANATIGRAMSLIMINLAGRIPGEVSKSTFAQPARYTCCFGEYEEESPWEPYHVERGFKKNESTVTAFGISGTINSTDIESKEGWEILHRHANAMKVVSTNNVFPSYGSSIGIIFSHGHAKVVAEQFTKQRARQFMFEEANRMPKSFATERMLTRIAEQGRGQIQGDYVAILEKPEHLFIAVAGGHGGYHSVLLHPFAGAHPVTVPVRHQKKKKS